MNATAAKGARAEREAKAILESHGYYVIKAGGSKGPADLVAIRPAVVLFVQVKCGRGNLRPPEWNALLGLAQEYGAVPVLAEREDRKPMAWYRLAGPKVEGWTGARQPLAPFDVSDPAYSEQIARRLARLREVSGIDPVPPVASAE